MGPHIGTEWQPDLRARWHGIDRGDFYPPSVHTGMGERGWGSSSPRRTEMPSRRGGEGPALGGIARRYSGSRRELGVPPLTSVQAKPGFGVRGEPTPASAHRECGSTVREGVEG